MSPVLRASEIYVFTFCVDFKLIFFFIYNTSDALDDESKQSGRRGSVRHVLITARAGRKGEAPAGILRRAQASPRAGKHADAQDLVDRRGCAHPGRVRWSHSLPVHL